MNPFPRDFETGTHHKIVHRPPLVMMPVLAHFGLIPLKVLPSKRLPEMRGDQPVDFLVGAVRVNCVVIVCVELGTVATDRGLREAIDENSRILKVNWVKRCELSTVRCRRHQLLGKILKSLACA